MVEIRMHGRGGQGAVVACKILASAFFKEGKFSQAFPAFGVERRGAPVQAFIRVDDKPINLRTNIYEPDLLVVLDATLLNTVNVTSGLKEGGKILINTALPPSKFNIPDTFDVKTIDASKIAIEHRLGSVSQPIVNTAILGAFSRFTGLVGISAILEAIKESVPVKPDENAAAALEAFEQFKA
jgi:pyruvate ferredoxin oxidoreductase gamma subunit/2-oxoisovalerate ferredoxin oxidoreductase gamma subunit